MSENTTKPESIEQQAAELRRMQEAEAARKKADEDAQEAARKAQEAKDKAEREEAEQKAEAARLEALKPDLEKAQAWIMIVWGAIPEAPTSFEINDESIRAILNGMRDRVMEEIADAKLRCIPKA
jgi:multidrug efflux pump subunit AcrA (membrane-fusion protein)